MPRESLQGKIAHAALAACYLLRCKMFFIQLLRDKGSNGRDKGSSFPHAPPASFWASIVLQLVPLEAGNPINIGPGGRYWALASQNACARQSVSTRNPLSQCAVTIKCKGWTKH